METLYIKSLEFIALMEVFIPFTLSIFGIYTLID